MTRLTQLTVGLLVLSLCACNNYVKETVPLAREKVTLRVPNQQRLIALATAEAVERLQFGPLSGKKVVVELTGVFPHAREDVGAYIQGEVEGKLARDGAIVLQPQVVVTPSIPGAEGQPAVTTGGALVMPTDAEYRVIVGVSWAGVDTQDKKTVDGGLLAKQIGLGLGGGLLGGILILAGGNVEGGEGLAMVGGIVAPLAISGAVLWSIVQPPTLHIYKLMGRVRLSVEAVPLVPGGRGFQTVGEGQTEIVIDPTAEEGYLIL